MAIRLGWYIGPGPVDEGTGQNTHGYYNSVPTLIAQGHDLFFSCTGRFQLPSGEQEDIRALEDKLSGWSSAMPSSGTAGFRTLPQPPIRSGEVV